MVLYYNKILLKYLKYEFKMWSCFILSNKRLNNLFLNLIITKVTISAIKKAIRRESISK